MVKYLHVHKPTQGIIIKKLVKSNTYTWPIMSVSHFTHHNKNSGEMLKDYNLLHMFPSLKN